ncbi:hypothetical protein OC845_001129 [Tilletia horrida]|nr:hypothetical protein OC845_001129 [Tilletia horrida]
MLDHILGRPSTRLKRAQVITVLSIGLLSLLYGDRDGPRRIQWIRWLNRTIAARSFSPWQIIICTITTVYAIRNLDHLFGFGAPEPLARMYSRAFYRTTWINTALDAGFATSMNIRPQWLKDILALLFSAYYLIYANEADEKLRKYRAFCTVEMMRETWQKTTNPYIWIATWIHRPSLKIAKEVLLPRPSVGKHASRPTVAWLYYDGDERSLRTQTELILDIPGGGFICMDPRHHEERLRALAKQTGRPVLALNYCKAPEFPYPFALEECYDAYRTLYETRGSVIGMGRGVVSSPMQQADSSSKHSNLDALALEKSFRIILSGDSAGGNLATGVMMKIIEYPQPHIKAAYDELAISKTGAKFPHGAHAEVPPLPKPIAILLAYPAMNFAYSSWMKPEHIRVLRQQSEVNLQTMRQESESSVARLGPKPAAIAGRTPTKVTPGQSPLNPNRSGRRPSLNARVGLPSSLEQERQEQLRKAGVKVTSRNGPAGRQEGDKDVLAPRKGRDRAVGMVPPPGVPQTLTSPTAILNSFMDKAQQVIRRSASRNSINRSPLTADQPASGETTQASKDASVPRPGVPKRDRSYSSLAGQAQMHLMERARFAEAEPSASEDEAGPGKTGAYTPGSFGDEDANEDGTTVDSLDEAKRRYHQGVIALTASGLEKDAQEDGDGTSSGYNTDHENRAHEEQQKALRAAADAADARMASARAKRGQRAYGTRLTMTSMAGYFNDRILTQSMMRAMAILYIGPKYQPDFDHDYYLSPIVAPAALLAEFPPVLFVCGEKDPICDDTVVMAGRIREAKTAKKRELERRRAGPSSRFGEGLRMSSAGQTGQSIPRDPIEDESPEDWVQMRIIEGWSHGFLQMSALMPEAKEVIKFLGVWMWETFDDWNARNGVSPYGSTVPSTETSVLMTGMPGYSLSSPGSAAKKTITAGTNQLGTPGGQAPLQRRQSEGDDDEDEPLSFTTAKSRKSPVGQSGASADGGSPALEPSQVARSAALVERTASPLLRNNNNGTFPNVSVSPSSSASTASLASAAQVNTSPHANSVRPVVTPSKTDPSPPLPASVLALKQGEVTGGASGGKGEDGNQTSSSASRRSSFGLRTASPVGDERERRGSGTAGGGGLDEKYKSMLVQESQLLQRRRGDAVYGLVEGGAIHDGSEDDGEGEAE